MIRLPHGWCIDACRYRYMLYMHKISQDGEAYLAEVSFHDTFAQAFVHYSKTVAMKMTEENDMEIGDAAREIGKLTEEIRSLRKRVERLEFSKKEVSLDD